MRQITFELLRHGPPHNQLLSPLTDYLALCGNHAAVTLRMPFEHNQVLHRLRALSYLLGEEPRTFQLKDSADALGRVLGLVPGLVAELNRDMEDDRGAARREASSLTHVRLVISASELALLPFELALTPNGFPGAGQPLLLQSQEPICLTREVRRVPDRSLRWPEEPRVLFASAAPAGVPPVPAESHRKILERLLDPWVDDSKPDEERARWMRDHLQVIENASSQAIERACSDGRFSHIHILAHGAEYRDGYDVRFGLALHSALDPDGSPDIVSGERLATILRPARSTEIGSLALPLAVTLASCNGANQGTVAGVGASIAHALHSAGIPIVIASQFPLSVAGSIVFVEVLYSSLLWAEDPRIALIDLRRRLHSQFPTFHDWASVTAYVSLPSDFEHRLSEMQIGRTKQSIDAAINYADYATKKLLKPRKPTETPETMSEEEKSRLLERARQRIETGRRRVEALVQRSREEEPKVYALLAATEKRCAEVYFSFGRTKVDGKPVATLEWVQLLRQARQHYWDAFALRPAWSWAVVQYLSLDLVLRRLRTLTSESPERPHDDHNNPEALWTLAHVLSMNDLRSQNEKAATWALGNLLELYVIAPLVDTLKPETYAGRAQARARELVDRAGSSSFEVYSTRRQMLRYDDWYCEIAMIDPLLSALADTLEALPVASEQPKE
jgi:hypothetical protein